MDKTVLPKEFTIDDVHQEKARVDEDFLKRLSSSSSKLGITNFEEPQVVRYRTGEEFSWHYDEIPHTQLQQDGSGGQRIATLLVYLNSIEDSRGGGTVFRDLVHPGGFMTK